MIRLPNGMVIQAGTPVLCGGELTTVYVSDILLLNYGNALALVN